MSQRVSQDPAGAGDGIRRGGWDVQLESGLGWLSERRLLGSSAAVWGLASDPCACSDNRHQTESTGRSLLLSLSGWGVMLPEESHWEQSMSCQGRQPGVTEATARPTRQPRMQMSSVKAPWYGRSTREHLRPSDGCRQGCPAHRAFVTRCDALTHPMFPAQCTPTRLPA